MERIYVQTKVWSWGSAELALLKKEERKKENAIFDILWFSQ